MINDVWIIRTGVIICHPYRGSLIITNLVCYKHVIPKGILVKRWNPACYKYLISDGILFILLTNEKHRRCLMFVVVIFHLLNQNTVGVQHYIFPDIRNCCNF